jgi:hypothetical protein
MSTSPITLKTNKSIDLHKVGMQKLWEKNKKNTKATNNLESTKQQGNTNPILHSTIYKLSI